MDYSIINFNEEFGVITIAYADGITINLDIPFLNNSYPTQLELDNIADTAYPYHVMARKAEVAAATGLEDFKALLALQEQPQPQPEESTQPTLPTQTAEQEIAARIESEALFREEITNIVKQVLASA